MFHAPFRCVALTATTALLLLLTRPAAADDSVKPSGKCMMWTAKSATATVYLVGSTHFGKTDLYPLPKEMEDAFAKSDTLVVECNIDKDDMQEVMKFVLAKGMYPAGETVADHLTPEHLKDLKATCESIGMPAAAAEKMKPWLIETALDGAAAKKAGLDPGLGIDEHFLGEAEKKDRPIEELESMQFQLNLLAGLDAKLEEQDLAEAVSGFKEMPAELTKIVDTWRSGDAEALNKLFTAEDEKSGAENQKLIYDRNGPMAKKVEKYLRGNKTVFICVGCAHVVGDKGIVKILKDDKVDVEQSNATSPPVGVP
jgi:uncharacterized protein YbaP (TraB family)